MAERKLTPMEKVLFDVIEHDPDMRAKALWLAHKGRVMRETEKRNTSKGRAKERSAKDGC